MRAPSKSLLVLYEVRLVPSNRRHVVRVVIIQVGCDAHAMSYWRYMNLLLVKTFNFIEGLLFVHLPGY